MNEDNNDNGDGDNFQIPNNGDANSNAEMGSPNGVNGFDPSLALVAQNIISAIGQAAQASQGSLRPPQVAASLETNRSVNNQVTAQTDSSRSVGLSANPIAVGGIDPSFALAAFAAMSQAQFPQGNFQNDSQTAGDGNLSFGQSIPQNGFNNPSAVAFNPSLVGIGYMALLQASARAANMLAASQPHNQGNFQQQQLLGTQNAPAATAMPPTTNSTAVNASVGFGQPPSNISINSSARLPAADASNNIGSMGRVLSLDQDEAELSPYQCLVRKQIEVFEQPPDDEGGEEENEVRTVKGRKRPVVAGQVGIRCRHCGAAPRHRQARGAVLFPSTLLGVYQTAQNMAKTHLIKTCKMMPDNIREELLAIRSRKEGKTTCKSSYGGGREYWAASLAILGVVDTPEQRLRFASSLQSSRTTSTLTSQTGAEQSQDGKSDTKND